MMRYMINERSRVALEKARHLSGYVKPLYDSYCFSQIPTTVLRLLGQSQGRGGLPADCTDNDCYERVILILIDGFGWKYVEKYKDQFPFLGRFYETGIVSKLTSQFPSTTAAHITTLCSNKVVGEHGIYEWFMYEPQVDRVVAPLPYTFAGDKQLGSLASKMAPEDFFPRPSFFEELHQHGLGCHVFQSTSIANSIYSQWMFDGAHRTSFKNGSHALSLLQQSLHQKGLFYLYLGDWDTAAHHHGVASKQAEKTLERSMQELEHFLNSTSFPSSTALLVTADHGMVDIHPKTTFYLNERLPSLERKLQKGGDGHVLAPAGSCRDFFLHVDPCFLDEVLTELQEQLHEVAWVFLTEQLIQDGFFGSQGVSKVCRNRMGNLTLIAKGSHSIWWHEPGRFEQKLYAMHGGLTPEELEITFLFLKLA